MPRMAADCVRNVVFDFGGVLVRWQPREIIDAFYRDPLLRERLRQEVFQHPDWLEMDRGTLAEEAALDRLEAFAALNGPDFYRLPVNEARVTLRREPFTVPEHIGEGGNAIVPFRAGESLRWRLAL